LDYKKIFGELVEPIPTIPSTRFTRSGNISKRSRYKYWVSVVEPLHLRLQEAEDVAV